jgi:phage terminase large subunit GpA-like protein
MANPWRAGFLDGLRPEDPLTVSEWSDRYRRLSSKASAEPGPWRTSRTPYLREPMDCLSSDNPVQRVVLMFAAQTGKTEAGSNWLGYVIDHAPGPMLCVQPTVEMAKRLEQAAAREHDHGHAMPSGKDRAIACEGFRQHDVQQRLQRRNHDVDWSQ